MSRVKKAPQYFLELTKEMEKMDESIAEMLDVGIEWIKTNRAQGHRPMEFIAKKMKDWPNQKRSKFDIILQYNESCNDYRWTKFRMDNVDNDFGSADRLTFDEKKGTIVIKKGVQEVIRKTLDKLKKSLPDINFKINAEEEK